MAEKLASALLFGNAATSAISSRPSSLSVAVRFAAPISDWMAGNTSLMPSSTSSMKEEFASGTRRARAARNAPVPSSRGTAMVPLLAAGTTSLMAASPRDLRKEAHSAVPAGVSILRPRSRTCLVVPAPFVEPRGRMLGVLRVLPRALGRVAHRAAQDDRRINAALDRLHVRRLCRTLFDLLRVLRIERVEPVRGRGGAGARRKTGIAPRIRFGRVRFDSLLPGFSGDPFRPRIVLGARLTRAAWRETLNAVPYSLFIFAVTVGLQSPTVRGDR